MKRLPTYLFVIFYLVFNNNVYSKEINGDFYKFKKLQIPLSQDGLWKEIGKRNQVVYGGRLTWKYLAKFKDNKISKIIEVVQVLPSQESVTRSLAWFKRFTFQKNGYYSCIPKNKNFVTAKLRETYFVYRSQSKGLTNCFFTRQMNLKSEVTSDDYPKRETEYIDTNHFPKIIKEYFGNEINYPKVMLRSDHYFFSQNGLYAYFEMINPDLNGAPKNSKGFNLNEYHPSNINNFPKKKEFYLNWIKIQAKKHKEFEKNLKIKKKYQLDLAYFIGDGVIKEYKDSTEVTQTAKVEPEKKINEETKEPKEIKTDNSSKGNSDQLNLNDRYLLADGMKIYFFYIGPQKNPLKRRFSQSSYKKVLKEVNSLGAMDGLSELNDWNLNTIDKNNFRVRLSRKTYNKLKSIWANHTSHTYRASSAIKLFLKQKSLYEKNKEENLKELINEYANYTNQSQNIKLLAKNLISKDIQISKAEPTIKTNNKVKIAKVESTKKEISKKIKSNNKNLCVPQNPSHSENELVIYLTDENKCKNFLERFITSNEHDYNRWLEVYKTQVAKNKIKIAEVQKPKQQEFKPETKEIDNEPPIIKIAEAITVKNPSYEIEGKVIDKAETVYVEADGQFLDVKDGKFKIKRFSPIDHQIKIVAIDQWGNKSKEKIINIKVDIKETEIVKLESLNPLKIKTDKGNNTVALIIGVEKYENTPAAKYANLDAKYFTEYAKNIFGASENNINLLTDEEANLSKTNSAIFKWLPAKIKENETDLIIFYSGHGLASIDGKEKYILPYNVDPDLLSRTAVSRNEFFNQIAELKPKSVTIFFDTCYSGVTRDEEMLLASARPLMIVADDKEGIPDNFTIFSASRFDQISSGLKEAKHGIFSYYLMKGLEGNADSNNDKKITNGELLAYMDEKVSQKAAELGRQQNPSLAGDPDKVLMIYK